jgi:tRNA pseudouridine38-40 synthase
MHRAVSRTDTVAVHKTWRMRFFFEIGYDGHGYAGWQNQANAVGVQSVVEDALSKLLRTKLQITGSGRTDAGVHCMQQFFHCDIEKHFNASHLILRLNAFLPHDIVIRSIQPVKSDASARYDATARTYFYKITRKKDPFLKGLAWHYFKSLDIQTMNTAAALLLGEQDFESFSKVNTDVNHFLCKIVKAEWRTDGDVLTFIITANRFLRGMVRAIVGTLLDVGTGKTTVKEFQAIINSRDRRKAGSNVPAMGLYLARVRYPARIFVRTTRVSTR